MLAHWAYILIGNNDTGKTSFQRSLVTHLCGERYERLPRNVVSDITHSRAPRGLAKIFTCNRSYQEKLDEYKSVEHYFKYFFKDADICVLSSHAHDDSAQHVAEMIQHLKRRFYNVAGVFWSNAVNSAAEEIALLPWNEVLWIENPTLNDANQITAQIDQIARHFSEFLIDRAHVE